MNIKANTANLLALVALSSFTIAPIAATAQDNSYHHRQQTKNQWRNIAIGAGALGAYGLATHNSTLGIAGLAGGVYSLSRYEHDRKSQNSIERRRAAYYDRPSYYRNGHRYTRRLITRNGQRYYTYHRG